ncbi:hypothetical protein EU805_07560 [Salipiger sp. IMCC34102]|uniref:YdeI/OmpD-associated family protein n=1 Tax=Salipiger sp. IMCC34102 TaxID=2510647 RepID=UPI00101C4FFC|nr:YdeI/OmpD-associated family protein [Salipiger sp. IMCC34102]RYH03558.1 hypothetical protein EU805_07560 [Salipiger sp. IMCC34102]
MADADVDALVIPADLQSDLEARDAAAWFAAAAPSYRRNVLRFLKAAKTERTRKKRIALIAEAAAEGRQLPNY